MSKQELLRRVMGEESMTQVELSKLSGVKQPNISGYLNGTRPMSDQKLRQLLNCVGYEVEIEPRIVEPNLTRIERRSWLLHRSISRKYDDNQMRELLPRLMKRLDRVRQRVTGEPHTSNVNRWEHILSTGDMPTLRSVLTGLDRGSVEMREVSPMSGLLTDVERLQVIQQSR